MQTSDGQQAPASGGPAHGLPPPTRATADTATRNAAIALALVIPGDTLLYLLLPLYAPQFGVTLPEVGILLAANRLVRIVLYPMVARAYAAVGPRAACLVATFAGIAATLCYATCSGLWLLLAGRLIWGVSFATLNLSNQALSTAVADGSARRSGRARSIIASGSMFGLVIGAILAEIGDPRLVFWVATAASLLAPLFALAVPPMREAARVKSGGAAFGAPSPMSIWAFCFGFTLDGIFVFGLSLIAKSSVSSGAVLAAGGVLALRYLSEMLLSPVSGSLAERFGAMRVMVVLSLTLAGLLLVLGLGGGAILIWLAVVASVLVRAVVQPLPPPVLAELYPGPERVPAMARQATWRDIGAGTGPLAAGALFPIAPPLAIWAGAALMLAGASLWLRSEDGTRRPPPS